MKKQIKNVVVHPLVLLSVVDHFNRVATGKRVVGALLGTVDRGIVDITNCFAIPFEETRDGKIWFLDHNYHEQMSAMFKKVSAREKVVGWYSTGPKIRPADIEINEVFRRYSVEPVLVIVDVQEDGEDKKLDIPTKAYVGVEEVDSATAKDASSSEKLQFVHIGSEIGALEAEEVGVEHLLRDIKDTSVSNLGKGIEGKMLSLKSLVAHLRDARDYLENVVSGKLPINHHVISCLQDVFNLMPNLSREHIVKSFAVKSHDMLLVIYLSSLVRAVVALHNLLNNKIANKEAATALTDKSATASKSADDKSNATNDDTSSQAASSSS
jgi:26S proteasome regulatory subunit N8